MNPQQLAAGFALIVCGWHLVPLGRDLYRNRKKSTPLPEDWGATVCAIVGCALIASYFLLSPASRTKWHGMLPFTGINLIVAGLVARYRYFGAYSKNKPKSKPVSPDLSKRIPHR